MYKKSLLQIIIFLFSALSTLGQIKISGYISDLETGERLIGATIYCLNSYKGTFTNEFGFFNLNYQKPTIDTLIISFVGYAEKRFVLFADADTIINIQLTFGKELKEINVYSNRSMIQARDMGSMQLSMETIKTMPALGGEHDPIKALQLLPGVQSGNEASTGFYVRGGNPGQNLISIDDVPLYHVEHLGGFVSVFNPDIIKSVKLVKGSFPARYGGRLSSIVEVRTNDGNMKERKITGTLGLISTKLTLEGPVKKDTSSYLFSVRRFMYDLLMQPATKIYYEDYSLAYTFYDINAKYNHVFSQRDRLYFSFYMGKDRNKVLMKNKNDNYKYRHQIKMGNIALSSRWNHVFSSNLFLNFTIYYTQYKYSNSKFYDLNINDPESLYSKKMAFGAGLNDFGLKLDFSQYTTPSYSMKYGAGIIFHAFEPSNLDTYEFSLLDYKTKVYGLERVYSKELYAYVENEFLIGKTSAANLGIRYSSYFVGEDKFHQIEPRAVLNVDINKANRFKIGYTQMNQHVHLLTSEGMGMPIDYWLPATGSLKPSFSQQLGCMFERDMPSGVYSWSIEPYYKKTDDIITFKQGVSNLSNSSNWEKSIEPGGKSESYGIEVLVQKHIGKYTGYLSYTISRTTDKFDNINNGIAYPSKYDRLHSLSVVGLRKITDNIDFSFTWSFASGSPFTLAEARYNTIKWNNQLVQAEIYSSKNAYRLNSYHRLDMGVNFYKDTHWGSRTISFNIYNAYNRKNPYFYFWDLSESKPGTAGYGSLQLYQFSYFPIIPSVSYSFKF